MSREGDLEGIYSGYIITPDTDPDELRGKEFDYVIIDEFPCEPKSKWSGLVWLAVIGLSLLAHWMIWIHRL